MNGKGRPGPSSRRRFQPKLHPTRRSGEAVVAEVEGRKAGWGARLGGGFIVLVGLPLLIGGAQLGLLHGSDYYVAAGLGLVVAGVQLARGRASGGIIFALVLLGTLGWALWESGLVFWPLVPRVFSPLVIGLVVLLT